MKVCEFVFSRRLTIVLFIVIFIQDDIDKVKEFFLIFQKRNLFKRKHFSREKCVVQIYYQIY